MAHTLGPWKAEDGIILPEWPAGVSEITDGSGYVVAFVPLHRGSSRNAERENWPSLIAAVPTGHELIQRAVADRIDGQWLKDARAYLEAVDAAR